MNQNNFEPAAIEATANNQVNNSNTNFMNNIIDFSNVWGEGAVAHTATIDQQVVKDLFHAFLEIPQEVVVKFRNEDGFLKMVCFYKYTDILCINWIFYNRCTNFIIFQYKLGIVISD